MHYRLKAARVVLRYSNTYPFSFSKVNILLDRHSRPVFDILLSYHLGSMALRLTGRMRLGLEPLLPQDSLV